MISYPYKGNHKDFSHRQSTTEDYLTSRESPCTTNTVGRIQKHILRLWDVNVVLYCRQLQAQ